MKVDRARIEAIVPQSGAMCLLDAVSEWDDLRIACTAVAPGNAHPLARDGVVPAVAACEYGAQAAAIHGSLVDPAASVRAGLLASLVDVQLFAANFPPGADPVIARAHMRSRTADACLYAFEVEAGECRLAEGQLMVAFTAPRIT